MINNIKYDGETGFDLHFKGVPGFVSNEIIAYMIREILIDALPDCVLKHPEFDLNAFDEFVFIEYGPLKWESKKEIYYICDPQFCCLYGSYRFFLGS